MKLILSSNVQDTKKLETNLFRGQVGRAASLSQEEAFATSRRREGFDRDFLVLTFHPALSAQVYDILRSLQVVFESD